jgi:phosphoglycerate dehydrogenase-like enzyme
MELRVHFQNPLTKENQDYLTTLIDPNITLSMGTELGSQANYHILVSGRPSRELLTKSSKLEAVIIPWAGVPQETRELLSEFPHLRIHNLHYNAAATAELAVALLLAAAKSLIPIDRKFRDHDWTPRYLPNPSILLEGKQALILGYGEIGRRVGKICSGLGLRIIAVRRTIQESEVEGQIEIYPGSDLDSLLPRADFLIVCLPETPETQGMIGEEEINQLPNGAIVVNIARGEILQEKALYEALSNGKLASAGIDVWYQYPEREEDRSNTPPSKFPFHELENVVMSPHRAGGWAKSGDARMEHLANLLNCAARNEHMGNLVDVQRGY